MAKKGQYVLTVLKAQDLVLLCRDQSTHDGCHLRRNAMSLVCVERCEAVTPKDGLVSTGNAGLHIGACLGDGGHG